MKSFAQYLKEDQNHGLKAPNGKISNLTRLQYNQVRSENFKAWFGDWENDPKNASKMLDENGEPMVFYHGTYSWNPVDSVNEYINKLRLELDPKDRYTRESIDKIAKRADKIGSFDDRDMIFFVDSKSKDIAKYYATNTERTQNNKKPGSIIQCFINARNPLVIDFNGQSYDDLSELDHLDESSGELVRQMQDLIDILGERNPYFKKAVKSHQPESIKPFMDLYKRRLRSIGQLVKHMKNTKKLEDVIGDILNIDPDEIFISQRLPNLNADALGKILKTIQDEAMPKVLGIFDYDVQQVSNRCRSMIEKMHKDLQKYDIIIGKNVKDMGSNGKFDTIANQYVCLNAKQIKSASDNNGQFAPNTSNMFREAEP